TRFSRDWSSDVCSSDLNELLEETVQSLADSIGSSDRNIIYTSGATEAINLAFKGLRVADRKHIVTVSTEHSAVLDTCSFLKTQGYSITYLPVDNMGFIDLIELENAISEQTLLENRIFEF